MPSAAIRSLAYDASRHELTIGFAGGVAYVYSLVPAAVFAELEKAPSRGAFVNARIRDRFPFRRLPSGTAARAGVEPRAPSLKDRLGASLAEEE